MNIATAIKRLHELAALSPLRYETQVTIKEDDDGQLASYVACIPERRTVEDIGIVDAMIFRDPENDCKHTTEIIAFIPKE